MICKSYGVETTIRHVECELIVGKNNSCIKCRNYRPCLRALRSKQHNQKKKEPGPQSLAHSFINNRYLTQEECASKLNERKKEIKALSSENVYLRKQIHSMIEENEILGDINSEMELLEQQCLEKEKDASSERELATHALAFMVQAIF